MNEVSPRPIPDPDQTGGRAAAAGRDGLALVATYKLAIGLLLVVVALDLITLLDEDLTEIVHGWILRLHADPHNPHVVSFLAWVGSVDSTTLEAYSVVAGFYGNLHLIEGIGLWLRKHWAEYLTLLSTMALVPLELYELFRNRHVLELLILVVNLAVVLFLYGRLRSKRPPALDGVAVH